jgi:hypothetical protein
VSVASAARLAALALALGFVAAASAEDAPAPAAPPPVAQPSAAPDAPKDPESCLAETGDYVTHGSTMSYVIGIENRCGKRLKCKIDAYVVGAKGPASAHTTMILGPASSGAAKKSYPMKVKAVGGTAQVSRDCRVF